IVGAKDFDVPGIRFQLRRDIDLPQPFAVADGRKNSLGHRLLKIPWDFISNDFDRHTKKSANRLPSKLVWYCENAKLIFCWMSWQARRGNCSERSAAPTLGNIKRNWK